MQRRAGHNKVVGDKRSWRGGDFDDWKEKDKLDNKEFINNEL